MLNKINLPKNASKITVNSNSTLNVPDRPIIPFIEGDGIGVDITPAMLKVVNHAVLKAYGGEKEIALRKNLKPSGSLPLIIFRKKAFTI